MMMITILYSLEGSGCVARGQEPTLSKREECGGWRTGGGLYHLSLYISHHICRGEGAGRRRRAAVMVHGVKNAC
jgi:hypothetical protein